MFSGHCEFSLQWISFIHKGSWPSKHVSEQESIPCIHTLNGMHTFWPSFPLQVYPVGQSYSVEQKILLTHLPKWQTSPIPLQSEFNRQMVDSHIVRCVNPLQYWEVSQSVQLRQLFLHSKLFEQIILFGQSALILHVYWHNPPEQNWPRTQSNEL